MKKIKFIIFIILFFSLALGIYFQFDTRFFGVVQINDKYYIDGTYYFTYLEKHEEEMFIIVGNKVKLLDQNNKVIKIFNNKDAFEYIEKSKKYVVKYEFLDSKVKFLSKPKTLIEIKEFNINQ